MKQVKLGLKALIVHAHRKKTLAATLQKQHSYEATLSWLSVHKSWLAGLRKENKKERKEQAHFSFSLVNDVL